MNNELILANNVLSFEDKVALVNATRSNDLKPLSETLNTPIHIKTYMIREAESIDSQTGEMKRTNFLFIVAENFDVPLVTTSAGIINLLETFLTACTIQDLEKVALVVDLVKSPRNPSRKMMVGRFDMR